MEWKKFTIKTTPQAEDLITGILAELEIYSVEIEDNTPFTEEETSQMFVDVLPMGEDDGIAYVSFYVEESEDYVEILKNVKSLLSEYKESYALLGTDLGECSITTSDTEDKDWINNWKQFFSHFYIDDILFTPTWETNDRSEAELIAEAKERDGIEPSMVIRIDPGTAFGTGKHETTQLCIKELKDNVKAGDTVLDVGTGSGVLAMMAFKFGAKKVYATDLDPCSVNACEDNFEKNNLQGADFQLTIGNIIDDKSVQDEAGYGVYDIVVANILADILIPLMPAAAAAVKKGGVMITSGIIEGREDDVAAAMERAGFTVVAKKALGEWRMVEARKW